MGLRVIGSLSQPDVHAASLSCFLEDRLRGRQGLCQGGQGPWPLAWLLLVWACLAERSWDRVVAGARDKVCSGQRGGLLS